MLNIFSRLKSGLGKTRNALTNVSKVLSISKNIDDTLFENIEEVLIAADVGVETSKMLISNLKKKIDKNNSDKNSILKILKLEMVSLLSQVEVPFSINPKNKPYVILMIGVNGSGKTTTIGKLAHILQNDGKKVMLAAGDTFRAAAIEQLKIWGTRNNTPVISQQIGADSASVIFDALQSARAKNIDVLIADTAGRLHTHSNLMDELKKIKKVISKTDSDAPHEVMLVLDASIGQNGIQQAKQFNEAIGITGISITKLDGTAKGGIIFSIAKTLKIPIRFIGIGENIEDLQPFNAHKFVDAVFE